jgi:hypothetical protein
MESIPRPLETFLAALTKRDGSLRPKIEAGGAKAGNWWIDLQSTIPITIEWRPALGFGFAVGKSEGYGEGPTEIFRSPERAAHRLAQLTSARPASSGLRAIRELYDVTQDQIAVRLKKGQAAVSRLETRSDSRIETVSKFVQALGGRMEIRAVFPDSQLPIYPSTQYPARKARDHDKPRRASRA